MAEDEEAVREQQKAILASRPISKEEEAARSSHSEHDIYQRMKEMAEADEQVAKAEKKTAREET